MLTYNDLIEELKRRLTLPEGHPNQANWLCMAVADIQSDKSNSFPEAVFIRMDAAIKDALEASREAFLPDALRDHRDYADLVNESDYRTLIRLRWLNKQKDAEPSIETSPSRAYKPVHGGYPNA